MREERKVVTAVFADLVGSTALAERLDPEEVKLVVGEAIARIVRATEAFGGTVKDLAGDGVLALFGAPAAHEDDAERALRSALRIVQEIHDYGVEVERGWGVEGFDVRVGVATGPVVLGPIGAGERIEYAAFGDTVNTAARLQSTAQPGSILVAVGTQQTRCSTGSVGSRRSCSPGATVKSWRSKGRRSASRPSRSAAPCRPPGGLGDTSAPRHRSWGATPRSLPATR